MKDGMQICFGDLRRTVYAVKAMTLIAARCDPVNILFEDLVFVWLLAVLSLYDAIRKWDSERVMSCRTEQQFGVEEDVKVLLSGSFESER